MKIVAVSVAVVTCFCLSALRAAHAQNATDAPVSMVVPYPPGGGYDRIARLVAPRLGEALGRNVIVANRPGAGGTIAMAAVARAAPDGRTLVVAGPGDMAISPFLYSNLSYDTLRDFIPITMMAKFSLVLVVNPSLPAKSVRDLIALAKAHPGKLSYASSSVGSTGHISAELFKSIAGIDMVNIPYKGTGPALVDVVAGHVPLMFAEAGSVLSLYRSEKLRALAVTTEKRAQTMPQVPTMAEAGLPNYQVTGWWGLFAPAGTPAALIERIHREVAAIVNLPAMQKQIEASTAEASGMPPDEFAAAIRADVAKFEKVVKASGAKLN